MTVYRIDCLREIPGLKGTYIYNLIVLTVTLRSGSTIYILAIGNCGFAVTVCVVYGRSRLSATKSM